MKLWPFTFDIALSFDTATEDWWKPHAGAWRLVACGISVLYGARVAALGFQLTLSLEFYDGDRAERMERDDLRAAGVELGE